MGFYSSPLTLPLSPVGRGRGVRGKFKMFA